MDPLALNASLLSRGACRVASYVDDSMQRLEDVSADLADLQKAFDLGWDGKPFRLTSTTSMQTPSGEEPAPAPEAASKAVEGGALHRI